MRSRLSSVCFLIACLALLISRGALAQALTDDFETGNLSRWSGAATPVSGDSALASPDAGHRGNFGLRIVDSTGGAGSDAGNHVFQSYAPSTADVTTRLWFRQTSIGTTGTYVLFEVRGSVPGGVMGDLAFDTGAQRFRIRTVSAAGNPTVQLASVTLAVGVWTLVELQLDSPGSSIGRMRLYLDGVEAADIDPVDWSGMTTNRVALGEVSGALAYTGVADIDDYRAGASDPMSTLSLRSNTSTAAVGACVPLTVACVDSSGTNSIAPYAFTPTLSSTLGGTFFLDALCQTQGTTAVSNGAASAPAYFRPSAPGTHSLQAAFVDFVSAQPLSLVVVGSADAGSDAGSGSDAGLDGGADAGFAADSGFDAGEPEDAGTSVDAGAEPDAGDGGSTTSADGGSELQRLHLDVGCGCAGAVGLLPLLLIAGAAWGMRRRSR